MKFDDLNVVRAFSKELQRVEVGTIVCVFDNPHEAYLVEFCDDMGRTTAMEDFLPEELELVKSH